MSHPELLKLYDAQLRTEAEVSDAPEVARIGPLWCATFPERGRGFITYAGGFSDPGPAVATAIEHFRSDARVNHVEWKTRGHDRIDGLHLLLEERGFVAEEPETVMIGGLSDIQLASNAVPRGYVVERALDEATIREAESVAGHVFGSTERESREIADDLIRRFQRHPDSFEMWLVRASGGSVVCSGRVDFVHGTEFAGVWGGACLEDHRGKGLYRALTAARATAASLRGKKFLHSDCTEFSRPILQREGMVPVTTTTPYLWKR